MSTNYEELIRRFAGQRVLVVGDVMLDRYLTGRVRRISPEAPVPIVEVERTFDRPGGAGNVGTNTQRLGAPTVIVGIVGDDPDGQRLRDVLAQGELSTNSLITLPNHLTTVKTRILAGGQQVVRVDRELNFSATGLVAEQLFDAFADVPADVVILSDYSKGVLSRAVCIELIRWASEREIPVIVDPKGREYDRYRGATAVTPNGAEAAQAIGLEPPAEAGLDVLHDFFLGTLGFSAALITQGERGMSLLLPNAPPISYPATARGVADVTGAGDTAVSVFALAVAAGACYTDAAFVANVASGIAVGKAGAVAVTPEELLEALTPRSAPRPRRAR